MKRPLAAVILTAAAAISITLATATPALACGDTPGFCPNPPETNGQTHTISPDGTVGTSQDF